MVSSLLTGWLFELLGSNGLYTVMAGCCLAALVIFGAGSWLVRQGKPPEAIEITEMRYDFTGKGPPAR